MMTMTAQLITVASLYCSHTGRSGARISTIIFNDGKKLGLVEAGGDLNTRSFEKAMVWFSENWPDGLGWPDGIKRPAQAEAAP
jgi:hypothetical protein